MGASVAQLTSESNRIASAVESMKTAIAAKGVTVPADSSMSDLDTLIMSIGPTPAVLMVTDTLDITASAQTASIEFIATSNWTISSSESWCTFSTASGSAGSNTVTATFTENTGSASRSCTITVTCGSMTGTCAVTQAMATPYSAELNWLRSGNNCYIRLPFSFKYNSSVEFKYDCGEYSHEICGTFPSTSPRMMWRYLHNYNNQGTSLLDFPSDGGSTDKRSTLTRLGYNNTVYTVYATNASGGNFYVNVNGSTISRGSRVTSGWSDTIDYFYLYGISTGANNRYIKLYYFKMWDGATLVSECIPVLDNNNTPCFYDKVRNEFYYNYGQGTWDSYEVKS